ELEGLHRRGRGGRRESSWEGSRGIKIHGLRSMSFLTPTPLSAPSAPSAVKPFRLPAFFGAGWRPRGLADTLEGGGEPTAGGGGTMGGMGGAAGTAGGRALRDDALATMAGRIAPRGPDDDGFSRAPHAALGFRRLSIVALAGGHQPLSNEDG